MLSVAIGCFYAMHGNVALQQRLLTAYHHGAYVEILAIIRTMTTHHISYQCMYNSLIIIATTSTIIVIKVVINLLLLLSSSSSSSINHLVVNFSNCTGT